MHQNETMEDQYLDLMLKLALEKQESDEIQEVMTSPESPVKPILKQSAHRALDAAYARIEQEANHTRRQKILTAARSLAVHVFKIAACFALIIVITGPIAFAQSSAFRSKVMELLIQFDHNQGTVTFSFEENPEASFAVPEEWTGTHFMSYIPDGFEMSRINPQIHAVEYKDANNRLLSFAEYDEYSTVTQGTDETAISYVKINGQTACIIEGVSYGGLPTVSVTWTNQVNWFTLTTYGVSREETIEIVLNVKMINRKKFFE